MANGERQNAEGSRPSGGNVNESRAAAALDRERGQERLSQKRGSEPVENVSGGTQVNAQRNEMGAQNIGEKKEDAQQQYQPQQQKGVGQQKETQAKLQQQREQEQQMQQTTTESETKTKASESNEMNVGVQIWIGLILRDILVLSLAIIPIIGNIISSPFAIMGLVFVLYVIVKNIKDRQFAEFFARNIIGEHGAWLIYLFAFSHTLAVAFVKYDYEYFEGRIEEVKPTGQATKSNDQKGRTIANKLKSSSNK